MASLLRLLKVSSQIHQASFSFSTSSFPKRVLARTSRHQVPNYTKSESPHPKTIRLLKRIASKENDLGFSYGDLQGGGGGDKVANHRDLVNASRSIMRLYSEAGRPRQEKLQFINGWDRLTIADRADRFWEHLSQSMRWNHTTEMPPLTLLQERLRSLLYFSRPDTPIYLESALKELEVVESHVKESELNQSIYGHLVANSLWCRGTDQGYDMYNRAEEAGAVGRTDKSKKEFLCEVSSHLGEAVADFNLVVDLANKANVSVSPAMYVSWLEGVKDRRGEKSEYFELANSYLSHPALKGFEKYPEVKSALIDVAAHDRSPKAIAKAFQLLDQMTKNKETPSMSCLNALARWCTNQRPARSSLTYGPTHSKLQAIEKAMVSGKVRPTPRILGNLLAGYGVAGDAVSALGVYRNMRLRGIYLNKSDYTLLLHAISSAAIPSPDAWRLLADPTNLVNGLFEEISEAGVLIDTQILNAALRIFSSTLRIAKHLNERAESFQKSRVDFEYITSSATLLFRTMREGTAIHPSVRADRTTFSNMIKIYCLSGNMDSAVKMLDTMKAEGIEADIEIYNYIYEYLSAKDWRQAEDLLTIMTNKSLDPNPNTMNAFLKGYAKSGNLKTGFSMVQACYNQYGVRPTKTIFLHALETLLETEDMYEARRIGFIYRQLWPNDEIVLQQYMKGAEKNHKSAAIV